MEALELLSNFLDASDPDVDEPNLFHAFQTAERARQDHPHEVLLSLLGTGLVWSIGQDWLHLTGLIHDVGKLMGLWGEPQWAVVGDTFVTGAASPDAVVLAPATFKDNPDLQDPRYKCPPPSYARLRSFSHSSSTKYGMYEPNCGLSNLQLSWGHDEYLYQVLLNHKGIGSLFRSLLDLLFPVQSAACRRRPCPSSASTASTPGTRAVPTPTSRMPRTGSSSTGSRSSSGPSPTLSNWEAQRPWVLQQVRHLLKGGCDAGRGGAAALLPGPTRQVHSRQSPLLMLRSYPPPPTRCTY